MKITIIFRACLFGTVLLSSCIGQVGIPGNSYLAISWDQAPEYYTDNNPRIPSPIQKNTNYSTEADRFDFEYAFEDGFGWRGSYEIVEAEPGGKAWIWREGEDGRDNFHTLILSYGGSDIESNLQKIDIGEVLKLAYRSENSILLVTMTRAHFDYSGLKENKL